MDKQDLPKAPLRLTLIVEAFGDAGDEWTGEEATENEVEEKRGKFQIHNPTTFNRGPIRVTNAAPS
jgi:hypothetical protein